MRDNHGVIIDSPDAVVPDAWDSTSAVIVATKREQRSSVVVAAGFSYPQFIADGQVQQVSMDFGEEAKCMDALTDRFWQFLHVELNEIDDYYELGFVANAASLKWLVFKGCVAL
jgi:hypothetical protein